MRNKPSLKVKSKIWIELMDEVVCGQGRVRLFEEIEKTGSTSQAAALLGMSFRDAWGKVTATEDRLKLQLVERQQGNRRKGTTLTPAGKEILNRYTSFQREAHEKVDELFEKHLEELLNHLKQHIIILRTIRLKRY
ncbi:hypothetical protein BACCIP111895_04620 [Neobacillus rhizosphaerae]|uniref:HTH lysR-type domain-containing protein n=1 Tax=Neobacillus rhizosphaerae TaxID=2880965 RepID=A0ABM9EXK9_9BACI|nr:LysR family transcriptional regulator [Neobacillus rhizosphaerae]CAH2717428.1 hypothetical protein BACCIP111895_04620 [Neobacillus rhizosphaerae]